MLYITDAINLPVDYHYFLLGLQNVTALWPAPNYSAWRQADGVYKSLCSYAPITMTSKLLVPAHCSTTRGRRFVAVRQFH